MKRPRPPGHEERVLLLGLLSPLPAVLVALGLLWTEPHGPRLRWALGAVVVAAWLGGALALRDRVVRALQTITNLLGALREGDFSVRGPRGRPRDALADAIAEING